MTRFLRMSSHGLAVVAGFCIVFALVTIAQANPDYWKLSWPKTDFSRSSVDFSEIFSGGPPKDGIPSIDRPRFAPVGNQIEDTEPVIAFAHGGDARAYPLRILIWHEIVNDVVGGLPVAVTYCPLCNASIVFDRRYDGRIMEFGTTGKLRNSDLVMYDRQTESWWQQFSGTAIVGKLQGAMLAILPSRVESFARFRDRFPEGKVLLPTNPVMRPYGMNPYVGYDSSPYPFLYKGELPVGIKPLAYVVRVGREAWPLETLRKVGKITRGDLELTWSPGQNSALDNTLISDGRDIGNVVVQRVTRGSRQDVAHDVTFAFVFHAFVKGGTIHN